MIEVILRGSKVVLREKRVEDGWKDYSWRIDEELATLDATIPLRMSFHEYLRFYREELKYPTPWSRQFAIDTLDGEHIGNCMYYDINSATEEAELGIMIGEKYYWNKGYGYDAMVTLAEHVFYSTALTKLYLHTLQWNTRARRAFQNSGFVEKGIVKRKGKAFSYMELTRKDWINIRSEKLAEPD